MADYDLAAALADADPVAALLDGFKTHPKIADVLGGPDHVSGIPEDPWPHLSLGDGPGGDLRDLRWNTELEVDLVLTGSPDGAPGQAALRHMMLRLLVMAARMSDTDGAPGAPVLARVRPSGVLTYTPQTNGQPVWTASVYLVTHPPFS